MTTKMKEKKRILDVLENIESSMEYYKMVHEETVEKWNALTAEERNDPERNWEADCANSEIEWLKAYERVWEHLEKLI